MAVVAKVVVEKALPSFDRPFDYRIAPEMSSGAVQIAPGCRVTVPFGPQNRRRQGLVVAVGEQEGEKGRLKTIASLVDESPILNEEQLGLITHLRETTFCSYFDALRVLIPAGLGMVLGEGYRLSPGAQGAEGLTPLQEQVITHLLGKAAPVTGERICEALGLTPGHPVLEELAEGGLLEKSLSDKRKIQDERVVLVRLAERYLGEEGEALPKLTQKQGAVVKLLGEVGSASIKEICYFCGLTRAVIDRLEGLGVVCSYEQPVYRSPHGDSEPPTMDPPPLTEEQGAALDTLWGQYQGGGGISLLRGVTGSGKTQIFLSLARRVAKEGRGVIVMVPEISLTPQTIDTFRQVFGGRTAVLHSSLTLGQRLDEWRRIREGKADIVIGTRSAVFAPLEKIGLIVMDEEQEHTYKSESSPRFHARDVAKFRCQSHGAQLLLCSATPSVESYYLGKAGRYQLVELTARYGKAKLPDVFLVDMGEEAERGSTTALSSRLTEEVYQNLQVGEQSILLLNRRGYHTVAKCSSCGEPVCCPNCSVSLTYHSANRRLLCHICGYTRELPGVCESCGSTLVRYSGVGTQKVEEQLNTLFPDARVLRMDMDTTLSRLSYEKKFAAFADGAYDIMVGTQMVAKGLNFPRVTLVGVLAADSALYSDDFRSFEKTFSLLTQVVGRSGRAELPGRAFIQTAVPENPIFTLAASQDYPDFYREEIQFRKLNLYPPFCDMVSVGFSGLDEGAVARSAQWFAGAFARNAAERYKELPIRLLGPSPGTVVKAAGKYRYKLLIKCRIGKALRELLNGVLDEYYGEAKNREVTAFVDPHYDASL